MWITKKKTFNIKIWCNHSRVISAPFIVYMLTKHKPSYIYYFCDGLMRKIHFKKLNAVFLPSGVTHIFIQIEERNNEKKRK